MEPYRPRTNGHSKQIVIEISVAEKELRPTGWVRPASAAVKAENYNRASSISAGRAYREIIRRFRPKGSSRHME